MIAGTRYGTHREPPPRLDGETLEEYLEAIRTAVVLYPEVPLVVRPEPVPKPSSTSTPRRLRSRATKPQQAKAPARPRNGASIWPQARQCAKCGTAFTATAKRASQQYCSVACGGMQVTLAPTTCARCGKAFQPRKATRRYCSVRCSHGEAVAKQPRPPTPRTRIEPIPCPICATPFRPVRVARGERKKTCSPACANAARAQHQRRSPQAPCRGGCGEMVAQNAIRRPGEPVHYRAYCSWDCFVASRRNPKQQDRRAS